MAPTQYRSHLVGWACYGAGMLILGALATFMFWEFSRFKSSYTYTYYASGALHTQTVNYPSNTSSVSVTGCLKGILWFIAFYVFHLGLKRMFREKIKNSTERVFDGQSGRTNSALVLSSGVIFI